MPEEIKKAQISTQATIGVTMGAAVLVSAINMTSPLGIWSLINLFQMLLILILTGAYIPTTVKQYLSGMDFVQLNFDFIPFIDIPLISDLYLWMKFDQSNDNFKYVGLDYGSATVNNISFLVILLIFIIFHLPIALIYTTTKSKSGLCSKLINIICTIMTFTAYIRLLLENFQYMLLCSISEAYEFDLSTKKRKVSLFLAHFFLITSTAFYFFIIYQFQATRTWLNRKYYKYSEELFGGLKESNKARSYTIFLTTRRFLLCIILICLQNLHFIYRVILFNLVQILYFALIIVLRPFTQIDNNIVEIVNELLLTVLGSLLLHYNESSRWDKTIENVYIYLITFSSAFV